jgi:ATP-dependent RNA helicase RhlE
MPFRSLQLHSSLLQAIAEAGYTEPTPIQQAAIPLVLTGQDVIGIAQTGTGKTAAFTLPILTRLLEAGVGTGIKVLILAPTRELVVQIEENVRAYAQHTKVTMATVFGGVGERPQMAALRKGVDIVIACPGRLLDLMQQGFGDFRNLTALVLDEADRMLDMGFLPSIRRIVKLLPQRRQTLMFSATLSKEIESLTHEFQRSPKTVQIGKRSNPAESVTQLVYEVPLHLKPALLAHLLEDPAMDSVLVFTRMKHGADRVAKRLEANGIKTATLHSNRSQNQRLRALQDFKAGTVRVLVATDIAARGIDVEGISHVVNYDFPPHAEDYVHRIGRTGRAKAVGDAVSFVTGEDRASLRALEKFIGRGLVRKVAEGFDYKAAASAMPEEVRPPRQPRQQQQQRRGSSGGGGGGGSRPARQGPPREGSRDSSRSSAPRESAAPRDPSAAPASTESRYGRRERKFR